MSGFSGVETLRKLYQRELARLRNEIELYGTEEAIWKKGGDTPNSAGNLCLHLVGNLSTYIGADIGNSGYVRKRDLEFSSTDISREDLLVKIDDTAAVVDATLAGLTNEALTEIYPQEVLGEPVETGYYLAHLVIHFAYHLGQINYHRRFFDATAS